MFFTARLSITTVAIVAAVSSSPAQSTAAPLSRVEPGLESAVKWKWWPAKSDIPPWGVSAPEPAPTPVVEATPDPNAPRATYTVGKGDALAIIARKHGLTVLQLKTFNALPSDMIRIGQVLNIPNRQEALAIGPFPEIVEKKAGKSKEERKADEKLRTQLANLPLQVYLDREQFSTGPIDGVSGPTFERVKQLYLSAHPELAAPGALDAAVREKVGDGLSSYTLKDVDFRYIAPPKAARMVGTDSATPEDAKSARAAALASRYEELVASPFLAYKTPWEFVAERFHCSEAFLRDLNPQITTVPAAGTEFRVPKVIPFTIERSLVEPLQPAPDSRHPITASVLDQSLLTITQNGTLIAVMPVSMARPGLRGKGTWSILNAIPRPRMATVQEPSSPPRPVPRLYGSDSEPAPTPKPLLEKEQYLASGPNNPAGIIWINLTKSDSTEPLPYGLTGTSIPDQMNTQESIGGIRMTNWDVARAVRHLPVGTPLEWASNAPVAPAAAPAALPALPASGSAPLFTTPPDQVTP